MAKAASENQKSCVVCDKAKSTFKCSGCLKDYCKTHLQDHEEELQLQLDKIENQRNIFKQTLSEQIKKQNKQNLIQQINQWEQKSIRKIQQTAEKNRRLVFERTDENFQKVEIDLNHLTNQIKQTRKENDFNEIHLNDLKHKLEKLQNQLNISENILLKETNLSSFTNKIYLNIEHQMMNIPIDLKWKQNGITIAGGNGQGEELNQLNHPWSISIDDEQTIYVVDSGNHRIVAWKKDSLTGQIVAGGNGEGNGNHQLNCPTNIIINEKNDYLIIADWGNRRVVRWPRRNGQYGETIINDVACFDLVMYKHQYLYVNDNEKHEVRRWKIGESEGVVVAGGNGCGSDLNQFNRPQFIFIDEDETLYVSDSGNTRVMKWVKDAIEGIVVAGGEGKGNNLKQLSCAEGLLVDRLGTLYVADFTNNRIVRWIKDAKEGTIIAGGSQANQFSGPAGLTFDDENNLYVADWNNSRIQKFLVDN